jgi:WD40 repeat protein
VRAAKERLPRSIDCHPTRRRPTRRRPPRPRPKGALGKFGAVELSDVAAFVALPNGKLLSGSEEGALLLWDANAIQAVVTRPGGAPCHVGGIEALLLEEATGLLVSGGGDGALRLWDVSSLVAEPSDTVAGGGGGGSSVLTTEATPCAEVQLPPGSRVRCMLALNRHTWLVVDDASGGLLRVEVPPKPVDAAAYTCSHLLTCPAGGIAGLATLANCHVAVTAGGDGSVRALDYLSGEALQVARFGTAASCLALLPTARECCCVAVGFADGAVRRLQRCSDGWALLSATRPHRSRIVALPLTSDSRRAASVAADGTVFFFGVCGLTAEWEPLGFCRLLSPGDSGTPTCAAWSPDGACLMVGCSSGVVFEVTAPADGLDTSG